MPQSAQRRAEREETHAALRRRAGEALAAIMHTHNLYLARGLTADVEALRRALTAYHSAIQALEELC